ncbi:MAG: glycosyltransferase [Candidatus Omnitrophota bacterium]
MSFEIFIAITFPFFISYFLILMLYYCLLIFIGFIEGGKRSHQHHAEDYASLSFSTFTIPVSIIVPAHNEEVWIRDSLLSILNLDYPKFEVIVVDDESTDGTLKKIDDMLDLDSANNPFVDQFKSGKISNILKSNIHPNVTVLSRPLQYKEKRDVTVISKHSGYKKAGALNTALNMVKYKYVCIIDGDTILEPDALKKVMIHIQKNPENIIGIGSYFGLVNGFTLQDGMVVERHFFKNLITAYQNLEYIRSFIGNRIAWSRYNCLPIISGGFAIWRRDVIMDMGGFSTSFSSEDLEFTFRAQEYVAKNKEKRYRIMMLPYYVGWTQGPSSVRTLIQQRNRWQRIENEGMWRYRHMLLNPKYGAFAFLSLPYFLLYEVLGVFFELFSIILVLTGALLGFLDVKMLLAFLTLMILSYSLISISSLFSFIRNQKMFRTRDLFFFICLSFLESFWYRWVLAIAKISGTYSFLRRVRSHDQYLRTR